MSAVWQMDGSIANTPNGGIGLEPAVGLHDGSSTMLRRIGLARIGDEVSLEDIVCP